MTFQLVRLVDITISQLNSKVITKPFQRNQTILPYKSAKPQTVGSENPQKLFTLVFSFPALTSTAPEMTPPCRLSAGELITTLQQLISVSVTCQLLSMLRHVSRVATDSANIFIFLKLSEFKTYQHTVC